MDEFGMPESVDEMTAEQRKQMHDRFPDCMDTEGDTPMVSGKFGVWTLFSEGYPDEEDDVLVSDGEFVYSALSCWDGIWFSDKKDQEIAKRLTHWMRYPDPPNVQTQ